MKQKKRVLSLSEVAREAAAAGLSYGEYVAGTPPRKIPAQTAPEPEPEAQAAQAAQQAREARIARLRAMAEAGLPAEEMAQELGLSVSRVYQLMRQEEIHIHRKARARHRGDEPERWSLIRRMRGDGLSIREIAQLLKMSAPGVRYAMRSMGLPKGEERGGEAKAKRQSLVLEMLEQGVSATDMALRLGTSRSTVYNDLHELGALSGGDGRGTAVG